jgi:hypothetical protein
MRDKTDAELYALGWTWVKRTSSGGLLAVTVDAQDASDWMRQDGSHTVTRLRAAVALQEGQGDG